MKAMMCNKCMVDIKMTAQPTKMPIPKSTLFFNFIIFHFFCKILQISFHTTRNTDANPQDMHLKTRFKLTHK